MHQDDDTRQGESLTVKHVDENPGNSEDFTLVGEAHGHVGAAVRILRKLREWSQGKLAEKAGVHLNTVHRFEADPADAETQTLGKLAAAFGHSPTHLLLLAEHLTPDGQLDLIRLLRHTAPPEGSRGLPSQGDTVSGVPLQRGGWPQDPVASMEMSASGRRITPLLQYVLQSEELSNWLEEAVRGRLAAPGKPQHRKSNG